MRSDAGDEQLSSSGCVCLCANEPLDTVAVCEKNWDAMSEWLVVCRLGG